MQTSPSGFGSCRIDYRITARWRGRETSVAHTDALGRGLDYRDVGEGFRAAVKAAGLTGPGRLTLHSLRHTFTWLLIAKGLDVVFVSRQLGHASPATTLGVYAHLFDQVQHAATARAALEESYQTMTGTLPREPRPAGGAVVALMVAGESGPATH